MRATEHLIVGGGLAGAMAGIRLASAGRAVTILEREATAHPKVCGEFLSREAVEYLNHVGVDPLALGGTTIRTVRFSTGKSVVEAPLPFTACSLSRGVLDEALLAKAAEAGCEVVRGAFVDSVEPAGDQWRVHLRSGESWTAKTAFLATGKHDLRGRQRGTGVQSDLVGFKMHCRLTPANIATLADAMELYLFTGGYGGLSLVEDQIANFCFVIRRSVKRKRGGWTELLALIAERNPHVAARLTGATFLWEKPLAISPIPYGYLSTSDDGLWRLGDQSACIPSFTGDGMSIALHSGALAAQMFLRGATSEKYQRTLRSQLNAGMTWATSLSRFIVTGAGRAFAPAAFAVYPRAMNLIAVSTRIPHKAVRQALAFAPTQPARSI